MTPIVPTTANVRMVEYESDSPNQTDVLLPHYASPERNSPDLILPDSRDIDHEVDEEEAADSTSLKHEVPDQDFKIEIDDDFMELARAPSPGRLSPLESPITTHANEFWDKNPEHSQH